MKIVTSSFFAWRPEFGVPVSIALRTPKEVPEAEKWDRVWAITPRWSYFRAPFAEYDAAFIAQCDRYGLPYIHTQLARIAEKHQAEQICLCCWEPTAATCHRGLVAAWFLQVTGEKITEMFPGEDRTQ